MKGPPSSFSAPPHLTLFEPFGLGAGGTGAAAGLIHPFAPTGKPMWRGEEAFAEAEALVAVAEGHQERESEREGRESFSSPFLSSRSRMLRPAEDARQAADFAKRGTMRSMECSATPVGGAEARRVLPGVSLPFDDEEESSSVPAAAALVVEGGLVVDPGVYLRHLWAATVEVAEAAGGRAVLDCDSPPVRSLAALDETGEGGEKRSSNGRRFDVVIVAAGAAAGAVAEVGGAGGTAGVGSCELVQGWTVTVAPCDPSSVFPESALLGKTYAAPRRRGGGNGEGSGEVAVGATRSALPVSALEALAHCASRGRGGVTSSGALASSEEEAAGEASRELLERFARLWPPAAGGGGDGEGEEKEESKSWGVVSATSGVRARPRRSGAGRPPLAGKLESGDSAATGGGSNWWAIGGLGSRGLLYSAWLGREVARAALADVDGDGGGREKEGKGGDSCLDPELTRWKRWKKL